MSVAIDQSQISACAAAHFLILSGEYLQREAAKKEKKKEILDERII